jgi:phenylpyruvate tautomerase
MNLSVRENLFLNPENRHAHWYPTNLPCARDNCSLVAYPVDMPYLSIQTNSALRDEQQTALLDAASKIVASQLGKPESYVMASFVPAARMRFAGEESPTAFLELSSIGIPDSKRNPLVAALTDLVTQSCGIKPDRIFVVLADIPARFWSLNGATFA